MDNLKCFYRMLGWKGGTVHQVAAELGVHPGDLLYGLPKHGTHEGAPFGAGKWAFNECSTKHMREEVLKHYKGNLDFWLGYKRAAFDKANK